MRSTPGLLAVTGSTAPNTRLGLIWPAVIGALAEKLQY